MTYFFVVLLVLGLVALVIGFDKDIDPLVYGGVILIVCTIAVSKPSQPKPEFEVTCRNDGETVYVDVVSDLDILKNYETCTTIKEN